MSSAGLQVPFTPLLEISGKGVNKSPSQILEIGSNRGLMEAVTVIVDVVVVAH